MSDLLGRALGLHPAALEIGSRRLETLAANIANADTPGFRARDVDFRQALAATGEPGRVTLQTPRPGHLPGDARAAGGEWLYRVPSHPSLDGNTVDLHREQAAFAEAAVRYQASLEFLDGRVGGLRKALRGE